MSATTAQNLPAHTFGELLRHLRQRARLTQDELGLAVGYSRAHIARLENGQRAPDPAAVRARFFEPLDLKPDSPEAAHLVALASGAHASSGNEEAEPERQTPNNLPYPVTSFVGRNDALAELQRLLATTRLLTLTGVGGTGKTRLALELAGRVLDDYPDGVWLVELAPVADPVLVPATVLSVLSTPGHPDLTATESVSNFLKARRVLLILDNCEHVIDAAAQLADAVGRACGQVRILATSREALNIPGELSWRVPSLLAPPATSTLTPAALARHEAVQLFVERAAFAQPGFAVTQANAAAIQQICTRLDGIPLALELAAARIKTLTPEKIAERLSDRFRLLTGGSRTSLPRQQTLQALVDWSYRLLTEPEKSLLRRLAVFIGGWTLEAAEAVCASDDLPADQILNLLGRLVDKSLVIQDDSGVETRYTLLETIRQFALERLNDTDEAAANRDRHLHYFLDLGKYVWPQLEGMAPTDQVKLIRRLAPDIDNIRRASEWAAESERVELGWDLLEYFYGLFIPIGAQLDFVDRLLALLEQPSAQTGTLRQAKLYILAALVKNRHGFFDDESAILEKVRDLGHSTGDAQIEALAMGGFADNAQARGLTKQSLELISQYRSFVIQHVLLTKEEIADLDSSIALALAEHEGRHRDAVEYLRPLYLKWRQSDHKLNTSAVERSFGHRLLNAGDLDEAAQCFRISMIDNHALGDRHAVAACLGAFAALALARGDHARSVRLLGASEAIQETVHARLHWSDLKLIDKTTKAVHGAMGHSELQSEWARGRAMSLELAMAYALEDSLVGGAAV